jgi:hypothetical protein
MSVFFLPLKNLQTYRDLIKTKPSTPILNRINMEGLNIKKESSRKKERHA